MIHKSHIISSWAYILCFICVTTASATALGSMSSLRKIGPVFEYNSDCLAPLLEADANGDSILSREEYMTFVQLYSSDAMFRVESFADFPIPLVLEFTQWTCSGYCNFFTLDPTGVEALDCLKDCQDGIPLAPPENFGPLDLKPYLYSVCASTYEEVKGILNITDDEDEDDTISSPEKRQVEILFGMANLKNLNAVDIAQDKDGSLNQVLLPTLKGLYNLVKENLYVERLGGRLRRTLLIRRHLQLNSEDAWIKTIDNRGKYLRWSTLNTPCLNVKLCFSLYCNQIFHVDCPGRIRNEYPEADCQRLTGIFAMDVEGEEDPDALALQVTNQAQRYIRDGDFQSLLPEDAKGDYIFYSLETTSGNSFPLYAIVGVAAGAVLIGLFAGRALIVNRRRRGSQVPDDDLDSDEAEFRNSGNGTMDGKGVELEKGESVAIGTYGNADRISVDESESDMGSSGWSSSAGLSSLNTGASVDSAEILVSSLAAIGAASHVHKKYSNDSTNDGVYPIHGGDEESSQSERYVLLFSCLCIVGYLHKSHCIVFTIVPMSKAYPMLSCLRNITSMCQ